MDRVMTKFCMYPPFSFVRGLPTRKATILVLVHLFLALSCGNLSADEIALPSQYQVKAAFIYNFMKYVDWPESEETPQGISLGILGKDSFDDALDVIKGKMAKGRRVVVVRPHGVENARRCDVLFIGESERGRLPHILKSLQDAPVLTVADQEGFCEAGGMINMITEKNKIRLEINVTAARKAGLRLSSKLLKLARTVF